MLTRREKEKDSHKASPGEQDYLDSGLGAGLARCLLAVTCRGTC